MQLVLLIILGLLAVFSVAAFASKNNPIERPIVYAVCAIDPQNIVCANQTAKP